MDMRSGFICWMREGAGYADSLSLGRMGILAFKFIFLMSSFLIEGLPTLSLRQEGPDILRGTRRTGQDGL